MNKILQGDVIEQLKTLPDGIVQTCVTSPPYWGLRDYGTAKWEGGDKNCDHKIDPGKPRKQTSNKGTIEIQYQGSCKKCGAVRTDNQLGLEKTPEEYTEKMVKVFREVKRVLRDDGTLWLNLGDSYNTHLGTTSYTGMNEHGSGELKDKIKRRKLDGLKPKDLIGIPWRVAFALQKDGWYLRSDIIWSKPAPMPESATDRPTNAHEHIFLLAKSGKVIFWTHRDLGGGTRVHPEPDHRWVNRDTGEETAEPQSDKKKWRRINLWRGHDYYYDAEAIKEPASSNTHSRGKGDNPKCYAEPAGWQTEQGAHDRIPKGRYKPKQNPSFSSAVCEVVSSRNKRSVWEVASCSFPEAHFATFPPKLIEPCILAGSAAKACSKCGAAWARQTETLSRQRDELPKDHPDYRPGFYTSGKAGDPQSPGPGQKIVESKTVGFKPSCKCNAGTVGSIVLDPFFGSGTTGLVAEQKGRRYIGIELSAEYIKIAKKRLRNLQPEMFT